MEVTSCNNNNNTTNNNINNDTNNNYNFFIHPDRKPISWAQRTSWYSEPVISNDNRKKKTYKRVMNAKDL